jgi:hypothetical protein
LRYVSILRLTPAVSRYFAASNRDLFLALELLTRNLPHLALLAREKPKVAQKGEFEK